MSQIGMHPPAGQGGRRLNHLLRSALFLLPLLFAVCALWKIWEQDVFNQIRSGDDFLRTGRLPLVDTWTYSSAGQRWLNLEWLFTVAIRLIYGVTGETYLGLARAALVGLLFFSLIRLLRETVVARDRLRGPDARQTPFFFTAFCLLPLLFVALSERLQLRPELVILCLFAQLLASRLDADSRRRCWATLAILIGAAQFHAGLAPLLAAVAGAFVLAENAPWRRRMAEAALIFAASLANPYGPRVFAPMLAHLFKSNMPHWHNPESASILHLQGGLLGLHLCIPLWLVLSAAANLFYYSSPRARRELPAIYSRVGWFTAVNLALTGLALYQIRALAFQMIFLVPVLALLVAGAKERLTRAWQLFFPLGAAWGIYSSQAIAMLPLGLGVDTHFFPVGATAFLRSVHPQGNIFHNFQYGSYLVWALKEYPIYVDSRESVYSRVEEEADGAFSSPARLGSVLEKYQVNTAVIPIPPAPGILDAYFPRRQWGIAYFDATSVVMLKRIPEHQAILEQTEYRVLDPTLPFEAYTRQGRAEVQSALRQEIARCRREHPDLQYCRAVHRAVLGAYAFLEPENP